MPLGCVALDEKAICRLFTPGSFFCPDVTWFDPARGSNRPCWVTSPLLFRGRSSGALTRQEYLKVLAGICGVGLEVKCVPGVIDGF